MDFKQYFLLDADPKLMGSNGVSRAGIQIRSGQGLWRYFNGRCVEYKASSLIIPQVNPLSTKGDKHRIAVEFVALRSPVHSVIFTLESTE